MIGYFSKALSAHFRAGRSLYLLTVFGVALGVASVLSIQIINRNAVAAFEGSVAAISGDADLTVLGRTPSFSETLYVAVLSTPGVQSAWPLYRVDAVLEGQQGRFLDVIGVDLFAALKMPWQDEPSDFSASLTTPGWAAVTPTLAKRMGWRIGQPFVVTIGSRVVQLVVGAMVDFQAVNPMASPRLVVMDIAQAQSLLGHQGSIHQIDLKLVDPAARQEVQQRLQAKLGESVRVVTPEQREQQAKGLLSAFRLNLTGLSLISLFVGLFLVYSSIQASLVRRRKEFGLLRSLGATRRQVLGLIMSEATILGGLGVCLGLPLGYWTAQANVEVVSATLSNLYLLEGISKLQMTWWLYALGGMIGMGGAAAGAILPALDMSRRDTGALLAAFTLHEKVGSLAPRLFASGLSLMAVAGLWYWTLGQHWQPAGFILALALLIGLPLLVPLLIRECCGRLSANSFGLKYSFKALAARLQISAVAVAALTVAISMLVGITLMIGSFRRTLEVWIGTSLQADIYAAPVSWRGKGSEGSLSPAVIAVLTRHPGVQAVDRLRGFLGYTGEQRIGITGVDMGLKESGVRFPLLNGDSHIAYQTVLNGEGIFIGETLARKLDLWSGDHLPIYTAQGAKSFPIAAVYYDYSTEGGAVVMDLETMTKAFGPGPINSIALYLKPGVDIDRVVDELKAVLPNAPLEIRSNRRLRDEVLQIFDQTFAVTRLLQVMSLLVAVSGIALMLLVLAREQVSELALYRSIGATRYQIFGIYLGKGLGMASIGLLLGLGGGILLAGILIFVINRAYFGWTIQPYVPWGSILWQATTIIGAAVLASIYPALRASRTPATELSRDDL
ncbi:MAG: ABC transporter permease [bacterium]|nr:ABC transporter permease [bacterium]